MVRAVSCIGSSLASPEDEDQRFNDDRLHEYDPHGLAFVADARGPGYGGYHAPFGIDPGLARLVETFASGTGVTESRLVAAVRAAHDHMTALSEAHEHARGGRPGLGPARAAADAVRPPAWAGIDSLAHFFGSVTACAVGADGLCIAQVGECRAYGLEDGRAALLLRDHTLPSWLEAAGASAKELREAHERLAMVVTNNLGSSGSAALTVDTLVVRAPATVALVTDGVWRCGDDAIAEVFRAPTREALASVLMRCAKARRDDATAVVLRIG